jgi:uncharacterized protein YecE (DUF72 family)
VRGRLYIGLSGWSYDAWKGAFYQGVPRSRWLEHYAAHFPAVEVNGTFYREQRPNTLRGWAERTPDGFSFAIKGHKYLTHNLKLREPEEPFARQMASAAHLGPKLRAVVWQLPGSLHKDLARLRRFAALLASWPGVGQAMEFRHPSWFDDEVAAVLSEHGIAACISDAATWPRWDAVIAPLVYVRLHGSKATYVSAYGRQGLAPWAERARAWLDQGRTVHVYFDNTDGGAAVADGLDLIEMLS